MAFDLDGTLIDCEVRQSVLMSDLIDNDFDSKAYWTLKRLGFNNINALHALGYEEDYSIKINELWVELIETKRYLALDRILDYPQDAIINAPSILITARKDKELLYWQLDRLGMIEWFDHIYVVDHQNVVVEKASCLRESDNLFFCGDSETDYKAALSAGVKFYGVSSGQRSEKFLIDTCDLPKVYPTVREVLCENSRII